MWLWNCHLSVCMHRIWCEREHVCSLLFVYCKQCGQNPDVLSDVAMKLSLEHVHALNLVWERTCMFTIVCLSAIVWAKLCSELSNDIVLYQESVGGVPPSCCWYPTGKQVFAAYFSPSVEVDLSWFYAEFAFPLTAIKRERERGGGGDQIRRIRRYNLEMDFWLLGYKELWWPLLRLGSQIWVLVFFLTAKL